MNQLCSHFEAYRDIPKITELREKFKNIKQILKSHVFSDFSRYVVAKVLAIFKNHLFLFSLEILKLTSLFFWSPLCCLNMFLAKTCDSQTSI